MSPRNITEVFRDCARHQILTTSEGRAIKDAGLEEQMHKLFELAFRNAEQALTFADEDPTAEYAIPSMRDLVFEVH